jgi:hypothetical protein
MSRLKKTLEINQEFKKELKAIGKPKKSIIYNSEKDSNLELTDNEKFMLRYAIKYRDWLFPKICLFPLSVNVHVDFVRWETENELIIGDTNRSKGLNKAWFQIKS